MQLKGKIKICSNYLRTYIISAYISGIYKPNYLPISYSSQFGLLLVVIVVMIVVGIKIRKKFRSMDTKNHSDFVEQQVNLLKKPKASAPMLPV